MRKTILITLLLMLSGACLSLQAQPARSGLEITLLKAKNALKIASHMDALHSNVDGFSYFSIMHSPGGKNSYGIMGELSGVNGFIDLEDNYLIPGYDDYFVMITNSFCAQLSIKQDDGDYKSLTFLRDKSGQGGYFVADENGPIYFWGSRYSLQTPEQIAKFDKALNEIIAAVKQAVQEKQDKDIAQNGWYTSNKHVRLVKQKQSYGDRAYRTNLVLLEKYERDSLFRIINSRPPDTVFNYVNEMHEKYQTKKWFLDYSKYFAYMSGEDGGDIYYTQYTQNGKRQYRLHLRGDKMSLSDLWLSKKGNRRNLGNKHLAKFYFENYGYTRLISPRRWLNLGIPQAKLNRIKTELFTDLKK